MCGGQNGVVKSCLRCRDGFKHSKGAMILFKPSLNVDILEITTHKNGRFLVANININQDDLCLVKYDAPNDQNQQVNFFDKIIDTIRRSSTNYILLGGDFNCPLAEVEKIGGRDKLHKKLEGPSKQSRNFATAST